MRHGNQRFTSGQGKNSGALHAQINDLWVLCSLCSDTEQSLSPAPLCRHVPLGEVRVVEPGPLWHQSQPSSSSFQASGCNFIAHLLLCYPLHEVWRAGFWCLSLACSQGQKTLGQSFAFTHISSSHQTAETTGKDETTWILNRTPPWGDWRNKKTSCSTSMQKNQKQLWNNQIKRTIPPSVNIWGNYVQTKAQISSMQKYDKIHPQINPHHTHIQRQCEGTD